MYADEVVENIDILVDRSTRLVVIVEFVTEFNFDSCKKALGYRVVPTVAFTAHALNQSVPRERVSENVTRILRASVGVEDAARNWPTIANGHCQGVADQLCID
jgi:hypothetical protein